MEKKIDLVINQYYELGLMTNPENGNYQVKTIRPEIETSEDFEALVNYAMPKFEQPKFTFTRVGDTVLKDRHLHYKEIPLPTYRLSLHLGDKLLFSERFVLYIGRKSLNIHEPTSSYYHPAKLVATMMKKQDMNTFKFFNELYTSLAKDFLSENKFKERITSIFGDKVESVSINDRYSPTAFRVDMGNVTYVIELQRDDTLKLIGQYTYSDEGNYTESIDEKRKQIIRLQNEIDDLEALTEDLKTN